MTIDVKDAAGVTRTIRTADDVATALIGMATAAKQDAAATLLTSIDNRLGTAVYFPATQPVSGNVGVTGTVTVTGGLTDAQLRASAVPVSGNVGITGSVAVTGPLTDTQLRAAALPVAGPLTDTQLRAAALPVSLTGVSTAVKQDAIITAIAAIATEATLAAISAKLPTLGQKAASGSVSTTLSTDQDPIFDHANGTKTALAAGVAATVLTPPAGAKFARISSAVNCFVRTDGTAAADAAGSIRLIADVPETIPVTAGVGVSVLCASAATVYAMPYKVR